MKTRVQKWGNSLAVRIPKSFAAEVGLHEDAAVELSVAKARALVVWTITPQPLTLEELLRGITDQNRPGEWDTGPAMGKEVLASTQGHRIGAVPEEVVAQVASRLQTLLS